MKKGKIDIHSVPIVATESLHRFRRGELELSQKEAEIEAAYRKLSETDFLCFTRGLTIASALGPMVFENCMAPFQRTCFEDMALSLQELKDGKIPSTPRWWIERTKKASKDADLAIIVLWLCLAPSRPFFGQIGAADSDQAGIVKDRITHLLHWNPWLTEHVELVQSKIRSKKRMSNGASMATVDILASDVAGAHGGTPDILIVNELSHITKWEFVENLLDNADGVPNGMVIIATNAGVKGTKAHVWRNAAIGDKSGKWGVHVLAKPAPWHDKATIAEAEKRNPLSRYLRLWHGKWVSGKGDAVSDDDINACFCLKGPIANPRAGKIYIGGLDLGISHDHSGFAILEVDFDTQKIRLAWMKAWEPRKSGEVDLVDVEDVCKSMSRHYRMAALLYDPHQAKLMAQRLTRSGVPMVEMSFSSSTNVVAMATAFVSVLASKKLECYDDDDGRLRRDFGKFTIVEKAYGLKLEAVSDEFGHADLGTALVIALPYALEITDRGSPFNADDIVAEVDGTELSEKEKKALPVEFKELLSMEEGIQKEHRMASRDSLDPFVDLT